MNVDPRGFYINEQGVVAPKQTVFNGGKRSESKRSQSKRRKTRGTRKNKKSRRKATRRNRRS